MIFAKTISSLPLLSSSPKKIMIFGRPGSGKSTFALILSNTLKLPLYHLDKYFFEAGWVERDYQTFLEIQKTLTQEEKWIIDGNSIASLEMRYSQADLVLYFNYPVLQCFFRILKRLLNKDPSIDDRALGCPERVRWPLLLYTWNFEKLVSPKITKLQRKYPDIPFVEICGDKALNDIKYVLGFIN